MATEFEIHVEGGPKVAKALKGAEDAVKDAKGALREAGTFLTGFYSGQVFASRGGAIGKPWPRLSAPYAAWKARRWPGRPPLVQSGKMIDSFKADVSVADLTIRNTTPHFRYHQSTKKRSKIPRRAMMSLTNSLRSDVVRIIDKHLKRGLA